jgi:hypothetical protein
MEFNPARICAVFLIICSFTLVDVSWSWSETRDYNPNLGRTPETTQPPRLPHYLDLRPPPPPPKVGEFPKPGETVTTPTPSPQSDYRTPYVPPQRPKITRPVVKTQPTFTEEAEEPPVRVRRKKKPQAKVPPPKPRVVHLGHPHREITPFTTAPPRLEVTDPSAGPLVEVPRLMGYSKEQALERLGGVKLQIKPLAKQNPNLKAGIIFEQDPPPGALVPPYTLVTFTMAETVPGKGWLWAALLGMLLILLASGYHLAKHLWRPTIRITPKTDMGFQQFAFEASGSGHLDPDVGLKLWMDPGAQRIETTGLLIKEDQ